MRVVVALLLAAALRGSKALRTLGPLRSSLALLRHGDFEHVASSFADADGLLALTLPRSRQRWLPTPP